MRPKVPEPLGIAADGLITDWMALL